MAKLSVICVISDRDTFEFGLKESLSEQTYRDYELIEVDNVGNRYDYLGLAYEDGLSRSSGEWICFLHPDLKFMDENALSDLMDHVEKTESEHPDIMLFATAGATGGADYHVISSMRHGMDKRAFAEEDALLHDGYVYVQTVDACCMIIRRENMERLGFWNGGLGFHMVAEELSLHVWAEGKKAAVIPSRVWHFSDGRSLDYSYFREIRHLIRNYRNIDYINTTSHSFKNTWYLPLHLLYREYRSFIWHKILAQ